MYYKIEIETIIFILRILIIMGTLSDDMNINISIVPNVKGFKYNAEKDKIVLVFRMSKKERLEYIDVIDELMKNTYYHSDTYNWESSLAYFYFRRPAGVDVSNLEMTGEHVTIVR